jgi:cytochrome c553
MRILLLAGLCLAAASTLCAQPVPRPARLGLCAACHGANGEATMPGVPNLAGQRLDYLRDALAQYRDGRRDVPVMRTAIGSLGAADLDALARWYSAQPTARQAQP